MRGKKLGEGKWVVVAKSFISRDHESPQHSCALPDTGERREGTWDSEEGTGIVERTGTAEKGQRTVEDRGL